MIQCRLKPLALPQESLNRYLMEKKFSTTAIHPQEPNNPYGSYCCLPASLSLNALFEKHHLSPKPQLIAEIGCGTGDFIVAVAATLSHQSNFIGIDHALPCIQRAILKTQQIHQQQSLSRRRQMSPSNLLFYAGDALHALQWEFPLACFDLLMINFPDPWPKKKHHKRRILTPSTVPIFARGLKQNGQLVTATDVKELHCYHKQVLHQSCLFKEEKENPLSSSSSSPLQWLKKHHSIYHKKNLSGSQAIYTTFHHKHRSPNNLPQ